MKPSSSPSPLLLVVLCHFLTLLPRYSSQNISEDDRQALLCLKSGLASGDDSTSTTGALSTWRDGGDFCQWCGVSCTTARRAAGIQLASLNLTGRILPCVGNLTSLTTINLAENLITGGIPPEIGRLTELTYLNLSNNALISEIPATLSSCSRLETLSLWRNHLEGEIPRSLARCSSLRELMLSQNNLRGRIPVELSLLPNLSVLYLSSNYLSGTIPPLLGSSPNLTSLSLRNNTLTGGIPGFLVNSSTLAFLRLASNSLTGELPLGLLNSSVLFGIDLSDNQFYGPIPEVSNASLPLQYLILSNNNLSGSIPSSLGNLSSLSYLLLGMNNLQGTIPASLGNITGLQKFSLTYNNLSGTVPPALYRVSSLTFLGLGANRLSGRIPSNIGLTLPNIQTLIMQGNQFDGQIPASLANASHLQFLDLKNNTFSGEIPHLGGMVKVDLSRNNLFGEIPNFLESESFSSLQLLNLSFNNFQGPVPTSGVFGNSSRVFVQGNKNLCSNSPTLQLQPCVASSSKRKRILYVAVTVLLVIIVLALLSTAMAIIYKRKKATTQPTRQSSQVMKKFSYHDLFKATSGFSPSNIIGVGRFGSVYRGIFASEPHIAAIKVFKLDEDGASKSFMAECEALRNTRHRNLVRVISVCSTFDPKGNEFKALVLEHMSNGNLERWLHPEAKKYGIEGALSFGSKVSIAADIAAALGYLHNQCNPPLVHCDLKPSNVLLDNDMCAHVGDFGLTKFLYNSSSSTSLVGPRGSIGYIAPEYGMGSKMCIEGDIYSYGIILLQMLTGKNPTDEMFTGGLSLRRFVELAFPDSIDDILEPSLILWNQREHGSTSSDNENRRTVGMQTCAMQLTALGLKCSSESPKDRPMMDEVYTEVASIKEAFFSTNK
uniref:Receptor kinase-like protein Xa21 n=1 Tax=Oryza glumipatula TaxID=40148 RepID=A0A0E0A971_9ORYZ